MSSSGFTKLLAERDQFHKKLLHKAFFLSNGNVFQMALGLELSRGTTIKYLTQAFGKNYKRVLMGYGEPK